MDFLRNIFPRLNDRLPLPALYVPTAYALYALTVHIPGKTSRIFITFPLLLLLTVGRPFYTAGSVGDDYGTAVALLGLVLMYIDFLILCPLEREPVRFTGELKPSMKEAGVGEDDFTNTWDRFKWSLRFMTIARAIGWNVQVKGVPNHLDAHLTRRDFVQKSILRAVLSQLRRLASVYCIGFAVTARGSANSSMSPWIMDGIIGWSGASWAYNGINALFNTGAAFTVAVGLCEPWEWPPIFGPLSEAWSVRQMWSIVWHQLIRRILQQPGIRLARILGLRKGTLGSRYLQLYVAFTISLLMHEWQIFNAVRRDVGEFRFFIVQPFVITAEDFVQWCWRKYRPLGFPAEWDFVGKIVGYLWTVAWFSYCLPPFVEGLLRVGIIGPGYGEPWAMNLGKQTAVSWLR